MPNKSVQRNTMIDLLTRVPVNRGGLLKSIDNLLKTIETSENAVMIPTLLKDKVRVDAWELLFVAKILKASVLGHSDLVEFYLNHIHSNSSHAGAAAAVAAAASAATAGWQTSPTTPTNGESGPLSPSSPITRQQSSPCMGGASPVLARGHLSTGLNGGVGSSLSPRPLVEDPEPPASLNGDCATPQQQQQPPPPPQKGSTASSVASSSTTATTATTSTTCGLGKTSAVSRGSNSKQSSVSWTTATAGSYLSTSGASCSSSLSSSSSSSSACSSDAGPPGAGTAQQQQQQQQVARPQNGTGRQRRVATFQISDCSPAQPLAASEIPVDAPAPASQDSAQAAAAVAPAQSRPPLTGGARHPQPPSLLQLTTTNNHINSVSELINNSPLSPSLEQLTSHLIQLQQQSQCAGAQQLTHDLQSLSISTNGGVGHPSVLATVNELPGQPVGPARSPATTPTTGGSPSRHELRSSRSAGCLFRANSGASSPRTPGTPYPQAETLASAGPTGLVGDPSSLVKLLLQVEQLKTSIVQVTNLLDSVVELYKKSIDNIAS